MRAEQLARILRPLRRAISSIVARAIVTLIDDSGGRQVLQLQVLDGELLDQVEHLQPLGISHVPMPPDGSGAAEAAVLFVGGSRSHGVAVVVDDRRIRPKGKPPGTTVVYSSAGIGVQCNPDGSVEITGVQIDATADADLNLEAGANLAVSASGLLTIDGVAVMIMGKDFLTHQHSGVTSGGGTTGPVV